MTPPVLAGLIGGHRGRSALFAVALAFFILAVAILATAQARIPFTLQVRGTQAVLRVGSQTLRAPWPGGITHAMQPGGDPNARLFQVDGTDISGTDSYNPAAFASIASSAYVRFLCWLRDCGSYSQWQDFSLRDDTTGRLLLADGGITSLQQVTLPAAFTLRGALQRPDVNGNLLFTGSTTVQMAIGPDARTLLLNGQTQFYPQDAAPFLAEVCWTLSRAYLWSLALLAAILAVAFVLYWLSAPCGSMVRRLGAAERLLPRWPATRLLPLIPLLAAAVILLELLGIATFDYQRLPRVYDGSTYFFQAKILRSGNLWAAAPPDALRLHFLGPFMVTVQDRWFALCPPGAPFALAVGMLFNLGWAVEPLLGAACVVLIAHLANRWYGKTTALLTLPLLGLSPFFLFLASSYLTHTVVLFALLLFLTGIDHLAATGNWRWAVLAGAGAGYAFLTRELDAVVFVSLVSLYYAPRSAPGLWRMARSKMGHRNQVLAVTAGLTVPLGLCLAVYLFYNWRTTGSAFLSPREVLSPRDTWGFGLGKGWYNQHTPAAGLFIMENLLTSLLIHLYGWPYYFTLAFFFLPLATLRLKQQDVLLYGIAAGVLLAYGGYYYHGIAFGPRYLFVSLPAYVLLTARGVTEAARLATNFLRWASDAGRAHGSALASSGLALAALLACNLLFYLPHQFSLYYDYLEQRVDGGLAYDRVHPPWMHQAIVLTDDAGLFGDVFFPLNDPGLHSDIVYARAIEQRNILSLMRAYPHRTLYWARTDLQSLRFQRMGVRSRPLRQLSLQLNKSAGLSGPGFCGLAVDDRGDLFVANANDGTILRFNSEGKQTGTIVTDIPAAALFRIKWAHNALYWLNPVTGMLWQADTAGRHRRMVLRQPCAGCGDFVIAPTGDIIVAQTSGSALLRFSPQGLPVARTSPEAALKQPTSVAVSGDGHVFTYDIERHQSIEFDPLLRRYQVLPFGSEANGSITRFSAVGDWLVGTDPAAQSLIAYNVKTATTRAVAVSSTGDILPVQGYGLAWNGRQVVVAQGLPGVADVLDTGPVPW